MGPLTYRDALTAAFREEMQRDETVLLLGDAIGDGGPFGVTRGLIEEFGAWRVRDVRSDPNTLVGMALGATLGQLRPVIELGPTGSPLPSLDRMMDLPPAPPGSGARPTGGLLRIPTIPGRHHGSVPAVLAAPGVIVATPSTPADVKGLVKSGVRGDRIVAVLEPSELYGRFGPVPVGMDVLVPAGRAVVRRPGRDVTLVGVGGMAVVAARAADRLADRHEIEAEVIDPRTVRPLDGATITTSVRTTHRCLVIADGRALPGVAASIAAFVQRHAFDQLDAPVDIIGDGVAPPAEPYEDGPSSRAVLRVVDAVLAWFD